MKVAQVVFKFCCIGFGASDWNISMNELVTKSKWMTDQYFLDLIGATYLTPSPNRVKMATHIGHETAALVLVNTGLYFTCGFNHDDPGVICRRLNHIYKP